MLLRLPPVVFGGDRVVDRRPQGDVVAALNSGQCLLALPARGDEPEFAPGQTVHLPVEVAGGIVASGVAGLRVEAGPAGMSTH